MNNRLFKLSIVIGILIILSGISTGISVNKLTPQIDYINITPDEAWDFLTDTSNGIQIPIDARSPSEWMTERIDTPFPEDPHRYSDWTAPGLIEFVSLYNNSEIILYCRSGSRSQAAAVHIVEDSDFNGVVYNMVGGITDWKMDGYPTKFSNHLPEKPETPQGPTVGGVEFFYTFLSSATDSDDDSVRYGWSWDGDDIVEEWTPYYASGAVAEISHNWSLSGTYDILVVAEDNVGEQSEFSDIFSIMIKDPPNPPSIVGETEGAYDEEYEYTFSSIDPEGVDIYLYVEWGDGEIEDYMGPYQSEEEIILKHTYTEEDSYTIRAKVKDIYDLESSWSELEVSMPKYKNLEIYFQFFIFLKSLFNFLPTFLN